MFNYYSNVVWVAFSYFFQQFYKPSNEVVSEKGHKKLLRKNLSVVSLHVKKKRLAASYSTPHDKNIYYFLTNGKQNNTALSWLLLCRLLLPHTKKNKLAFRKGVALSSILTVQQNSFCSFREARKLICYSFWLTLWILIINYKYNLFHYAWLNNCCCLPNKYFIFDY